MRDQNFRDEWPTLTTDDLLACAVDAILRGQPVRLHFTTDDGHEFDVELGPPGFA